MQKKYSEDEYKELIEKTAQGKATKEEMESVESLVSNAVAEIDTILKNNE